MTLKKFNPNKNRNEKLDLKRAFLNTQPVNTVPEDIITLADAEALIHLNAEDRTER